MQIFTEEQNLALYGNKKEFKEILAAYQFVKSGRCFDFFRALDSILGADDILYSENLLDVLRLVVDDVILHEDKIEPIISLEVSEYDDSKAL